MAEQMMREVVAGIALVVPSDEEQQYVHDRYLHELVNGIVLPETRVRLLEIVNRLAERERIQGLILGGTELSLILQDPRECRVLVLDTTRIHVAQASRRRRRSKPCRPTSDAKEA